LSNTQKAENASFILIFLPSAWSRGANEILRAIIRKIFEGLFILHKINFTIFQMWTDTPRPIVIAHRGDKSHAPENTLAAFRLAAEKGADAIEFDVKLSADGQVVVLHDQTVNRTTNGIGNVSKLPLAALRELDAGAWFSEQFRGECIPILDEVFETVGKHLLMNVELTNYATPGDELVSKVVALVIKHGVQDRTLFSSFLTFSLRKARLLLPQVLRGFLSRPGVLGIWGRSFGWRGDAFALHPYLTDVNPGLIQRIHAAGKRIHVWTINTEEDLKRMIDLGVDAVFTDDPVRVLYLLGRSM
jgi:glycerophosphoryl diester phosphodiesterase